ncbi:hypothetical protein GBAR_LOCUS25461, partial [Geodia barretti]
RHSPPAVAATSSGSSTNSGPTTDSTDFPAHSSSSSPSPHPSPPVNKKDSTLPTPQKLDLKPSSLAQSPSPT